MSTLTVLLTIGAIIRITRMVVADEISRPIRLKVALRVGVNHPITTLLTCTWCMSVWIGAAVCAAAYWFGDTRWWSYAVLAASASLLAGWTSRWLDPAED